MRIAVLLSAPLLFAGAALPVAVRAQAVVQPLPGTTDADRLADAVRRLGASPRDLSALLEAGDLSFRLGDASAAAAFFKRAEQVSPTNGRVKGGIARILVNGERPGEALRYFDQAQRLGAPMAEYADDRGLAYDLIGEQERAQRDYRLAMTRGDSDEIRRRYALSLGISGKTQDALAQIDELLRRSDRGAWRARAFILAMNGDDKGANKIATSMMPSGMAGGLRDFFGRLPSLSPADRAFAVHFGEVAPTAARIADARMVPVLPALGPDPFAPRPVQVAVVTPEPSARDRRNARRERNRRKDVQVAAVTPAPTPAPAPRPAPAPSPTPAPAPTVLAAAPPVSKPVATSPVLVGQGHGTGIAPATPTADTPVRVAANTAPRTPAPIARAPVTPAPSIAEAATPTPSPIPGVVPSVTVTTAATVPAEAAPATATATATTTTAPVRVARTTRPANVARTAPRMSEDSILARIVAGLTIPASELGVAPMPGAAPPAAVPVNEPVATASLEEAARAAERNVAASQDKSAQAAAAKRVTTRAAAEARTETAAVDRKTPAPKPTPTPAAKKALTAAERKAERQARAEADKKAAEKKAAAAEPARFWVQVAGGAREADLGKAWNAVKSKTPALAGRKAYSTPLRATNRVVTGPFKTEAEARAMVNTLAKQGVSAFTFASAPGQKMNRLDTK
jgi:Flp pilus assembly protein TadD